MERFSSIRALTGGGKKKGERVKGDEPAGGHFCDLSYPVFLFLELSPAKLFGTITKSASWSVSGLDPGDCLF